MVNKKWAQGHNPKMLGVKFSKEHKKKIGMANAISQLGKKQSRETRKKRSKSLKMAYSSGRRKPWNKGIPTKDSTKEKLSNASRGEKSYLWKGGISIAPYSVDWTKTLKRSIRERDKYICRLCGKPQGDISHDVHHIDYDKINCSPKNLITLCKKCHVTTNHNRDYWKSRLIEY